MSQICAIQIHCESEEQLKERMLFLFSKGLVFTTKRYRTWGDVTRNYADYSSWRFILAGHDSECHRILNTKCWRSSGKKDMTWDDFVKDMLPLL